MAIAAVRTPTPAARTSAPAKPVAAAPSAKPRAARAPLFPLGPAIRLRTGLPPTALSGAPGGGEPLASVTQAVIEDSLQVDLQGVRVHRDTRAQNAARNLSARAFTYGNQIFLGPGERPTDLGLMAHETTHVVQQQAAPRLQLWTPHSADRFELEAHRASAAVTRGEPFTVTERTTGPRIQRWGIDDVLDWIADKANIIPGFRMFTIILGVNPINMSKVDRSGANILRALIEFLPGGGLITQALENSGIFDKVGAWVEQQIKTLGMVGSMFKEALMDFLDGLGWTDLFHPGDVWDDAKRIFTGPIDRIISFAKGLIDDIIKFIKDAILMPLAKLAEGTRGWDLLIAVLGKNPITGDAVPRTAETLIPGFLKLIGESEVWENMKKANALARAWAWFQGALSGLLSFVSQLPTLAINAFKALELSDIILVPRAFIKVGRVFANFLGDFISWAGKALWNLLEIIVDCVSPGAMGYIKRTGAALKSILKNPLPFVRNLVKAAKLGFQSFSDHFGDHLKAGLLDWLTGSLPGIYIPKSFALVEIGKFVLSVLGLSWAQIRAKLVKALGPNGETIMKGLETAFDVIVALVKGGPAAAWDVIEKKLTNLKDMVIDGIIDLIVGIIVKQAVPKLIAMFIPGAGFISAILSIYDTVMVFVKKLAKIVAVVKGFIDSIVAIAAGQIGGAAKKVESVLAGLLSLAISFLAGFFGLGNVADKVMGVIKKVQTAVDKALDTAIAWIIGKAKALFAKLFGKKDDQESAESKEVKAKIKAEVTGKDVADQNAEDALLSALYSKYQPMGLKGIKFVRADDGLDVIVSASLAEKVATLTTKDLKKLIRIAKNMNPYSGKTTIYVSYDDGKSYGGPIKNKSGEGHAETRFKNDVLPKLIARIKKERKKLSTPLGQPVPVTLDINRSPCDGCSKANLIAIVDSNAKDVSEDPGVPLIRLVVNIVAMTKADWQSSEQTGIDSLVALRRKGVEINASRVWAAIEDKLKQFEQFEYESTMFDRGEIDDFKSKASSVQSAIDDAVKKLNESPADEKKGAV
jgi:hypothetical protein